MRGLQTIPKAWIERSFGSVLSPSQVKTFLDCSARWWFKHALLLPEPKTSSLALGLAVHKTLEVNFRQKLETREDLETAGMVMLFRDHWREQMGETEFRDDEEPLGDRQGRREADRQVHGRSGAEDRSGRGRDWMSKGRSAASRSAAELTCSTPKAGSWT